MGLHQPATSCGLELGDLALAFFYPPFGFWGKAHNGGEAPPFLKTKLPGETRFLGDEVEYATHTEENAETGECVVA
jgi:hypothetical protein